MRFRIVSCILVFSIFLADAVSADDVMPLSPEGEMRRAAHQFLMNDFIADRPTVIQVKGDKQVLAEVVVDTTETEVRDGSLLTLPDGAQRVAGMFRYIAFKGKSLDRIVDIRVLPFAPDSHPHESKQEPDFLRVQTPSMPLPRQDLPPMQIQFEMREGETALIESVLFNSQGLLNTQFDDIPYRNLGEEFARQRVPVEVVLNQEQSIDGTIDLQRQKWFRYYAAPGGVHPSFERWALERNFIPGRQIFKMQPALVKGYSKNQPLLGEIEGSPGKPDLSFFDQYDASGGTTHCIEEFRNVDYAMCFDQWPSFMSRAPNGRGTPLVEHFDDAAELVAAYVADQIKDCGRTATWWEVKNESSIKSEWDYHWENSDSWKLLADFHNRVADKIHDVSPGTKVGGPSSAWMQLQASDFDLYRRQAEFMGDTRGHLDFYSHHFYENIGSLGAHERRKTEYTNYLLGRFEAITDMIRAHMHKIDCVRPMLVTECGSLQTGVAPSDNWLRLRSWNAYLVKFMQRPDQFEMTVPFVFLQIPWNPTSGDAAFQPKEGRAANGPIEDFVPTSIANFFELWSDFDGRRLPVTFDQPWLDVVAVHQSDAITVAVCNMGGRRLNVDLSSIVDGTNLKRVRQKRLRYQDGEVRFNDDLVISDASSIPVDVEETTVITFELNEPLKPVNTRLLQRRYASQTAVKVQQKQVEFEIVVEEPDSLLTATLFVGVHRDGGLKEPLVVEFNGKALPMTADWASEMNHLFAPISVELATDQIQQHNEIKIGAQDGLTITSVHLEVESIVP